MPAPVSRLRRAGRALAEQAERLHQSLESLGERLNRGIAGEVARAVAAAAGEAVRAALDCRPADNFRRDYARPGPQSGTWDDPREPEWSDGLDDAPLRDEWDGGPWDEPDETSHRPSPAPQAGPQVLPLAWQGLLWLLGRRGRWAALGAGLLAAAAALTGDPLLASAAGAAALVGGLLALSDAARSGAAALSRAVGP
jgi:hypothetical protein